MAGSRRGWKLEEVNADSVLCEWRPTTYSAYEQTTWRAGGAKVNLQGLVGLMGGAVTSAQQIRRQVAVDDAARVAYNQQPAP
jgi:hypothetical protein